jgi:hypothetical protein
MSCMLEHQHSLLNMLSIRTLCDYYHVLCEQEAVAAGVTLNGQMCNAVLQGFGSDVEVRVNYITLQHIFCVPLAHENAMLI